MFAASVEEQVYDFVITMGDEIELMWPSGLSITEVLYYAARYTAWLEVIEELIFWFGSLDQRACRIFGGYHAFSVVVGMIMCQCVSNEFAGHRLTVAAALIIVRTWAIWNGKRVIILGFVIFCPAGLAVCSYLSAEWTWKTTFHVMHGLSPSLRGCAISSPYRLVYLGWVLSCACDITFAFFSIVLGERVDSRAIGAALQLSPVLAIANLSVTLAAAERYQVLLYGVERMICTILACRMMLNLRKTARSGGMPIGAATTDQTIDFDHPALQDQYELSSPGICE
ncbi:hypothetical protein AURDEDRAFT_166702 [Auricularia subglabra TFB-10046 SS5]|nr:hypothetical protein AURDEDRAFT_166702 [Auricularia subglabra TFB-10046 SS5]